MSRSSFRPLSSRIFGNCLVKNERDIIEETLSHAVRWCDRIFVFDNGSTDGTWEKVLELARTEPRIVPYKTDPKPFTNSLRLETFNQFRAECAPGDWWCRLDSDEIYIDDPREFLAAVPAHHHVVWSASFQFYYTEDEVARYRAAPDTFPPTGSALTSLRHYRCDYSEGRFFRYRPGLQWQSGSDPVHLGVVHPRRIRLRHYQYRTPSQITERLNLRRRVRSESGDILWENSVQTDWQQTVVPASSCRHIDEPNSFLIEESRLPQHVDSRWRRLFKYFMHGTRLWA